MHKILEEQLKTYIDSDGPFPSGWKALLNEISETYTRADKNSSCNNITVSEQKLGEQRKYLRDYLDANIELQSKLQTEKENVEKIVKERTKQYNEEAARLEASLNSLNMGLIITDVNKNVLNLNTAAKNIILSLPSTQTTSLTEEVVSSRIAPINFSKIQEVFANMVDLSKEIDHSMHERKFIQIGEINYGRKLLLFSVRPILSIDKAENEEREIIGVILIIQDITEQRALERSKNEFFSIASHELRTPLTAIRGNSALIKQYYKAQLNPDLESIVDDIHEASVRLIDIVNDFLDTSRLDMGKIQFKREKFDMVALVREVLKEYMTTGTMKKLFLHLEEPTEKVCEVCADKERVKQVLINLIGNSLKFTEAGGITVKLQYKQNSLVIMVIDTGKGISLPNQSLLFRKFQQAESSVYTRDNVHGTGLGLYISKMLVEGMGGTIWLEFSEEGKGTSFAFSLPKE